jgi:hypothetical protein
MGFRVSTFRSSMWYPGGLLNRERAEVHGAKPIEVARATKLLAPPLDAAEFNRPKRPTRVGMTHLFDVLSPGLSE